MHVSIYVQQMSLSVLRIIFLYHVSQQLLLSFPYPKDFFKKLELCIFNAGSSSHPDQSVIIIYLYVQNFHLTNNYSQN